MKRWKFMIPVLAGIVLLAGCGASQPEPVVSEAPEPKPVVEEMEVSAEPEPVMEEIVEEEPVIENPIDFDSLWQQNPDIYAWISIPDTQVEYPILHSTEGDVDHYLNTTVDGVSGLPGSIFTEYNYNPDLDSDPVTVIYGHNMKNESMFGSLKHYKEEEYRQQHPEIYIYTPDHAYQYRIVWAVTYDDRHILDCFAGCHTDEDYDALLHSMRNDGYSPSWREEPFTVTNQDRMIILSTCNGNETQRFLVGAVLTQESKTE